jgi:hypothetical protein
MQPHTGDTPKWAIVREIDFEVSGRDLRFFFSRGAKNVNLAQTGSFEKLVDDILEGAFTWYGEDVPIETPYDSPLSLQNKRLTYVVYVLSDGNWQFARRGRPFTIGQRALPAQGKPNIYTNARRVAESYKDADPGSPFEDESAPAKDNCKLGFFIANGENRGTYTHPINIHVDLIFEGTKTRHMPLIVDPDVRYPGGSNYGDDDPPPKKSKDGKRRKN